MADQFVKIEGLDAAIKTARGLTRKIRKKLLGPFFVQAGESILNQARWQAAVDTGRMRSSLERGKPGNIWQKRRGGWAVRIGTNVNYKGTSYPRILDESPRYHYRAGTYEGAQTRGWFSEAPQRAEPEVDKAVESFGREIQNEWRKQGGKGK
ncbi:hypothetical protein CMI37_13120 [Candidatus Pacearchaeota archaeon]|nr:hypothetical protein [Candidatus Pacearchaeota archaeon]|tara:strand:+ start:8603 stop:9058 length:456 start_codon:yes stop_codon:yes gene_type:complete